MAKDCENSHCSFQQGNVNQICKDEKWPVGHKVLVCDTTGYCCNCTCSCFVHGTQVSIPGNKFEAIQKIRVKDKVLAAGVNLNWQEADVMFSNGTSEDSVSFLLEISYKEGDQIKKLVCTEDQPLLMPSKLLKRADKLTAGNTLVLSDGGTAEVVEIKHVTVENGVHHISTGILKPNSLDGHLLNIQGVVAADYVVQLFQDELSDLFEASMFKSARNTDQVITLEEVEEVTLKEYITSAKQKESSFWSNTLLKSSIKMPEPPTSFLTYGQAVQVRTFVPKYWYGDVNRISQVEYLFKIFKAFYPEVNFLSDWSNKGGNAYMTTLDNEYYLILQGGLARCEPISLEGLAIIISHELGHIYGGDPKRPDGFSCDTQSDFYATRIVMRKVWYEDLYSQMAFPGIEQIKALFSYLSDAEEEVKGCITPTLNCRIETLMAGVTSPNLPKCATGPCIDYLVVVGAKANHEGEVDIYFNEEVNKESVEEPQNYLFTPQVNIVSVKTTGTDHKVVRIIANFEKDCEYQVTISNVTAKNGDALDPELNHAVFKAL
jgi:hypothetical protein